MLLANEYYLDLVTRDAELEYSMQTKLSARELTRNREGEAKSRKEMIQ